MRTSTEIIVEYFKVRFMPHAHNRTNFQHPGMLNNLESQHHSLSSLPSLSLISARKAYNLILNEGNDGNDAKSFDVDKSF
jgi:hypothetical protein